MGYHIANSDKEAVFNKLKKQFDIFAPKVFEEEGCFSDTDVIRYGKVDSFDEIEWNVKAEYSFKEALIPIRETLFYFTEDEMKVPKQAERKTIVFLRSCDIHALKRLDQIYLDNGDEDFYYKRRRENVLFALMGCRETCESGFCVSLGTNRTEEYDFYLKLSEGAMAVDCRNEELKAMFESFNHLDADVTPDFVTENKEKVTLPQNLSNDSFKDDIWEEYGSRCINCGRCNFVCPTCTCFTMQDLFYQDNRNAGERRRVWASCQVGGYTDMAGGISFRNVNSDKMRFKVMHKVHDFKKRFGYTMCVGCGRCDDVCPEYISYSNLINRLAEKEAE